MIKPAIALTAATVLFLVGLVNYTSSYSTSKTVSDTKNIPTATQETTVTVGKKTITSINLNSSNTIVLAGVIESNATEVAQQINTMSKPGHPLFLLINSPGGSILDGNEIVDAIQSAKGPVYTVCFSLCASMAAIVFETGTKRLMQDRSLVMFHEAAGGFEGQFNQMRSRFNTIERLVNKIDYEIAGRVGMKYEDFKALLPNELWLDAEDAAQRKFADGIVNVNLQISSFDTPQEKAKLVELMTQTKTLNKKIGINLGD